MKIRKNIENARAKAIEKGKKYATTIRQDTIRRAIERGEFKAIYCDYHMTDDYRYDAELNFGRGYVSKEIMLREYSILTPSCWIDWNTKELNGEECYRITINFHSNLSYSMYVPVA